MADKEIRTTSLKAYSQIKTEGLLSPIRERVYDFLFHNGPLTGTELNARLKSPVGITIPGYHKRLSELRELGVVREVGERICRVTGRNAIAWDVTETLPVPIAEAVACPKPTKAENTEILKILEHWQRLADLRGESRSPAMAALMKYIQSKAGTVTK